MSERIARALLALASRALGSRHRVWAQAMEAELSAAVDEGRPLGFAIGCLSAAWRELAFMPEGRFALALHLTAVLLIVPMAGVGLWLGAIGFPYLSIGNVGIDGFLAGQSQQLPTLLVGERAMAPALTLMVMALSVGQFMLALALVDRNWDRVSSIARFNAAALTTLMLVTAILSVAGGLVLVMVAAVAVETMALVALHWWRELVPYDDWPDAARIAA
ncbi:hypothetical protein [Sphingomonas jaspsi]|uniref:hypothetical protein n=1 Tax=Sphingomonas jaspsi TaxID=392409 RepID=UPI0004B2D4DC|nr:hypothetical protein [Sphingomonas jaspsi]